MVILQMFNEPVQQDSCQNFARNREQRYASMVVAGLAISFALVEMYDGRIFEVLGERLLLPYKKEKLV